MGKKEWEEFKKLMGVGEAQKNKLEGGSKKEKPSQKNTLTNYFNKAPEVKTQATGS